MTGTDVSSTAVRQQLRFTWGPFFTRFGRLTPVQQATIPRILDGANVIVASATASGKTEAVVAPVAERCQAERWQGLAILYIVPTRALANDTLARIKGPLQAMGFTAALKHGDKPYLPARLPTCLITTPESLDSLLCRRPEAFATVRALIIDEIHLLDNTYRGDQLRILVQRLCDIAPDQAVSTYLLSATVADPHAVAARYASDVELVRVPGQRAIEYHPLASHEAVRRLVRERRWKKVLYFCNRRASVERVGAELAPLWRPYPVVTHHGSLERRMREEAESVMQTATMAIGVATSTLEIGIDIGDIDLVVLAEVPWSLSALLQRVGRGNRRSGVVQAAAVIESDDERELLASMFEAVTAGALPVETYEPDLSVSVQQVFSYLFAHPAGIPDDKLLWLIRPLCADDVTARILQHLRDHRWIEWRGQRWYASTRVMDMGEKGRLHSNVPDTQSYRVIDVDSGREVGRISGTFDKVFVLARRAWRVVSIHKDVIHAQRFGGTAPAPLFHPHRNVGAFAHLLPMTRTREVR